MADEVHDPFNQNCPSAIWCNSCLSLSLGLRIQKYIPKLGSDQLSYFLKSNGTDHLSGVRTSLSEVETVSLVVLICDYVT